MRSISLSLYLPLSAYLPATTGCQPVFSFDRQHTTTTAQLNSSFLAAIEIFSFQIQNCMLSLLEGKRHFVLVVVVVAVYSTLLLLLL